LTFVTFDIERIRKIASKFSEKILIQVEGATCSGKSSFVSDVCTMLKQKGINVMIIEEAATKVFMGSQILLEHLIAYPSESKQWKKSKIELQQKVLFHQMNGLEWFVENNTYKVALMDRGGASTAYHTIPLLSGKEKNLVEEICREVGKMSSQIILLSPLGFLSKNSPRYQKTLEEIEMEYKGIKHFLGSWKLNYFEIASTRRDIRMKKGIKCIFSLLNHMEKMIMRSDISKSQS